MGHQLSKLLPISLGSRGVTGSTWQISICAEPACEDPSQLVSHREFCDKIIFPSSPLTPQGGPVASQADDAKASQVVVTGSLTHYRMTTPQLIKYVRTHFPALVEGGTNANSSPTPDFSIQFKDCLAEFFCSSTASLDFTLSVIYGDTESERQHGRAVAATESLVRTCETMLSSLTVALRRPYSRRKPRLGICRVEDPFSRSTILLRETTSPLRSTGAAWSFGLTIFWLIVAGMLVVWQDHVHQSADSKHANILAIGLSLGVAAISTLIPVVINWREWKRNPLWRYKGSD